MATEKVKRVDVSPTPHYPNWRYLCLECMRFHEKDYRMADFRMQCDNCQKKQIEREIKAGTMTPDLIDQDKRSPGQDDQDEYDLEIA